MQTVLFLAAGNNKKYPVYPGYCLCLTFLRENILFFSRQFYSEFISYHSKTCLHRI